MNVKLLALLIFVVIVSSGCISVDDLVKDSVKEDTTSCEYIECNSYCAGDVLHEVQGCKEGECVYGTTYCDYKCEDGQCIENLCKNKKCADTCDGSIRLYNGICAKGECKYERKFCQYGCSNGICENNPCIGVKCEDYCDENKRMYGGVCEDGECEYKTSSCWYGCSDGLCEDDPCEDVDCFNTCDGDVRLYRGVCEDGECEYDEERCLYGCEDGDCKSALDPVYCGLYTGPDGDASKCFYSKIPTCTPAAVDVFFLGFTEIVEILSKYNECVVRTTMLSHPYPEWVGASMDCVVPDTISTESEWNEYMNEWVEEENTTRMALVCTGTLMDLLLEPE